jgi:hypothetical protein
MDDLTMPIRAAMETAAAHGIFPDRCEILQNGSTLVLRLTESLVARVVTDLDGPRQGTEWFERENAVARYLAGRGAPVIPMHPALPPGPHEHLGHTLNFWQYVNPIDATPAPEAIGATLRRCHQLLQDLPLCLPDLAILRETLELLPVLEDRSMFPAPALRLLQRHLVSSVGLLGRFPHQALHGDAHPGNLMFTTVGLLWTDWEDTFRGPVEWDLASVIWNARILDEDHETADRVLAAYCEAGGRIDPAALEQSLIARAAVMSAWYPILYPDPGPERQLKLQRRLDWLAAV